MPDFYQNPSTDSSAAALESLLSYSQSKVNHAYTGSVLLFTSGLNQDF